MLLFLKDIKLFIIIRSFCYILIFSLTQTIYSRYISVFIVHITHCIILWYYAEFESLNQLIHHTTLLQCSIDFFFFPKVMYKYINIPARISSMVGYSYICSCLSMYPMIAGNEYAHTSHIVCAYTLIYTCTQPRYRYLQPRTFFAHNRLLYNNWRVLT